MAYIISFERVLEHERLMTRLTDLRTEAKTASKHARADTASPVLVLVAARLLDDIHRLISREPGARALQRIHPGHPPRNEALVTLLHDARLALDLFEWNHRAHDDMHDDDDWITLESIQS
ncbi:MAG: hypothetical protein P0Y65_01040 [Candidatus Devosia phytovorans]|uniref:Uncharacterized protein n=1 Tax=Candidatus Devosia phytovorans TaxID=3121372 RepID=A0AAJ5VU47_9HYPH|nr:hypothetical protein [Devosia sp.]WEK04871.1 MAG: hypothetical protein P0Y65_01040 [Devosia sp.]